MQGNYFVATWNMQIQTHNACKAWGVTTLPFLNKASSSKLKNKTGKNHLLVFLA